MKKMLLACFCLVYAQLAFGQMTPVGALVQSSVVKKQTRVTAEVSTTPTIHFQIFKKNETTMRMTLEAWWPQGEMYSLEQSTDMKTWIWTHRLSSGYTYDIWEVPANNQMFFRFVKIGP